MRLIEALKMSNWVQKDAAELLAISPRVMNYKIKTLGIEFPRGRRAQAAAVAVEPTGAGRGRLIGGKGGRGWRGRRGGKAERQEGGKVKRSCPSCLSRLSCPQLSCPSCLPPLPPPACPSRPRVTLPVHLEQLRGVDMRVALRGAEARMAEQFLDRPQVGAALQQMRGEGMPQGVRADAEPRAARRDIAPHEPVDAANGEAPAAIVDEQRFVRRRARVRGVRSRRARSRASAPPCLRRYARIADAVLVLNGTSRCFPPFPSTRTIFALRFTSSRSRPASSLSRNPDA